MVRLPRGGPAQRRRAVAADGGLAQGQVHSAHRDGLHLDQARAHAAAGTPVAYSDGKQVANRTIRVWHGATENGP